MAIETDLLQNTTDDVKNTSGQNIDATSAANDLPDYMELTAAAQWLKFPRSVEVDFKQHYYYSTIQVTRWAFVAGFLLYSMFGYLDLYVAPISLKQVWLIRFGIACPTLIFVVLLSLLKKPAPFMQLFSAIAATIGGLGIVGMILVTEPRRSS